MGGFRGEGHYFYFYFCSHLFIVGLRCAYMLVTLTHYCFLQEAENARKEGKERNRKEKKMGKWKGTGGGKASLRTMCERVRLHLISIDSVYTWELYSPHSCRSPSTHGEVGYDL